MGANPHTNGGLLLYDLQLPHFRDYAVAVPSPDATLASGTGVTGQSLRDMIRLNQTPRNFRVFGPDETVSKGYLTQLGYIHHAQRVSNLKTAFYAKMYAFNNRFNQQK